jgi:protein tyrosine phosphatase (PTP) superfamily phosphohydrolase (DUF442 family)
MVAACATRAPATSPLMLVNQVRAGPRIVTAGQPTVEQLWRLREAGVSTVLHIRSVTPSTQVLEEQAVIEAQGLRYVAVTVDPNALSVNDQRAVFAVLDVASQGQVLVHCDLNVLASAFVFLHRVLVGHEDLRDARGDLERMNPPPPAVRQFIEERLREAGLVFEDA